VADARRRYLEQLVESGERELVLPRAEAARAPVLSGEAPPDAKERRGSLVREAGAPPGGAPREAAPAPGPVAAPVPAGIVADAPPSSSDLFASDPIAALADLDAVAAAVDACRKCPLGGTRTRSVPGEGDPRAGFVCVGEAPGATEDETGRPFVGRAGKLLDEILKAIGFRREEVFICNVLKCRPPENRSPEPLEVAACSPYLHRQLDLIRPRMVLALGRPAAHALLGTNASLGDLRGRVHRYRGIPLIVTYHPAALLRNPHWKRPTWDDVRLARRIFDGQAV